MKNNSYEQCREYGIKNESKKKKGMSLSSIVKKMKYYLDFALVLIKNRRTIWESCYNKVSPKTNNYNRRYPDGKKTEKA